MIYLCWEGNWLVYRNRDATFASGLYTESSTGSYGLKILIKFRRVNKHASMERVT